MNEYGLGLNWFLHCEKWYRVYELTWVSAKTRLFPGIPPTLSGIHVDMTTGCSISWSWSIHGPCSPDVSGALGKTGMLPHDCHTVKSKWDKFWLDAYVHTQTNKKLWGTGTFNQRKHCAFYLLEFHHKFWIEVFTLLYIYRFTVAMSCYCSCCCCCYFKVVCAALNRFWLP
jgi:hypothetical protein